jgi:hypothetical protein
MHFHLPKPLHGWREFAGEVGIIVIGVLIALGAEQLVEEAQWHRRGLEAEAAMTRELGEDDGPQAEVRIRMSHCFDAQLDEIERALVAERDHGASFSPPTIAAPPFRTWDDNAWRAAVSSGATSHMTTARMSGWSSAYVFIPDMNEAALRESSDWGDLYRLRLLPTHPSETDREAMLTATGRARHDNDLLTTVSKYFLDWTHRAHVSVPESSIQRELQQQRKETGSC